MASSSAEPPRWCACDGHEKRPAAGVVVLGDCDEGSCKGHGYCVECIGVLTKDDPYNQLVEDWRPKQVEVPEITYVERAKDSDALRALADWLDQDDRRVFIGAWNMEGSEPTTNRLQVVTTLMTDEDDRG